MAAAPPAEPFVFGAMDVDLSLGKWVHLARGLEVERTHPWTLTPTVSLP